MLRTALVGVLLLPLLGCTAGRGVVATDSGTERFLAGDGIASYVPVAKRKAPPPLSGATLDGGSFDLASYRGGVAVVNVWGSWCAPCKAEQPVLERVATDLRSRGVRFAGIDIRDSKTGALRHVRRYGVTYPSVFDPSGSLLPGFGITAKSIPTTYVLDRDGRIAAYAGGGVDEPTLRAMLDRVMAET